jgi:dienelactone hydrolase
VLTLLLAGRLPARAQEYGNADRSSPGDAMIQAWLAKEAERQQAALAEDFASLEAWQRNRPRYREEYLYSLGLWPLPERTPLAATITGTIEGSGYSVDKLHYQSRPRLYVTANLYRPATRRDGERFPAVLYVCGHSGMGRNGNKTAFQSHGIWFARHGYVCLMVDTLQLGEIAALHHGTYREERWWWHSRGYTPAGVECWNGVRGVDYLLSRDDVDPERIAVTGISGGGAASFWIAAADERVRAAVPVSGMADLASYVSNRVINGHCDCMFLYNTFQWPWTRIAALVAPRPLLFANSHLDPIFPMDANERITSTIERVYALHGAGNRFDTLVSIGGHDYRQDIRRGAFGFIQTWLRGDGREVTDSEVDLIEGRGKDARHPISPEALRVFPTDADLPADQLNTTIDEHFVPMADVPVPEAGRFAEWKAGLVRELRRVVFRALPERVPAARPLQEGESDAFETEPGIRVYLRRGTWRRAVGEERRRVALVIDNPSEPIERAWDSEGDYEQHLGKHFHEIHYLETRGTGRSRWTRKNPPNYVERAHVLLGRTVDTGRVWDAIAVARYLKARAGEGGDVTVVGSEAAAGIAAFAALFEEEVSSVILADLADAYQHPSEVAHFLNLLRVCQLDDVVGMLAPRRVWLAGPGALERLEKPRRIYAAAGAPDFLAVWPE